MRWVVVRQWLLCLAMTMGAAVALGQPPTRSPEVTHDRVRPLWTADGQQLIYSVNAGERQFEYYRVQLADGRRSALFDPPHLAEQLSDLLGKQVAVADVRRISEVRLPPDQPGWQFRFAGQWIQHHDQQPLQYVEADNLPLADLLSRARSSRAGGDETHLTFRNQLDRPVVCHWLSTSGEAVEYATLAPRQTHEQHTFANHVWSVREVAGTELLRLRAPDRETEVIIDAEALERFQSLPDRGAAGRSNRRQPAAADPAVHLRDHNLWTGAPATALRQLSQDGSPQDRYREPLKVSASGRYVAAIQERVAPKRQVHVVESSPADGLQPKLQTFDYVKPGDELDLPRIRIFDLQSREPTEISHELMSNPWSLNRLQWLEAPERLLCLYNARGHQTLRVLSIDPATGGVTTLIEENSDTFIDYSQKTFLETVGDDRHILWMSERSGFNHLYRFDAHSGELLNAVTKGEWVVREVEHVDRQAEQIWFSASGLVPEQDPYYRHLCRVNFDGSGFVQLTEGNGDHRWEFSPDRKWIIDRYSRVDMPPVTNLRDGRDGRLLAELASSDWSQLVDSGWSIPQRFHAPGRDGQTEIYGILVWPSVVEPGRKYPVIEKIYAGPHDSHVPKAFGRLNQEHEIADRGFVVVRIDGMGTSNRGKAFHDVCWKNLADAGFPDRIAWLRAAAAIHPQIDLQRVGIFGGSAGGQNAMRALLDHHDFYDVAVADCGCHDNRMDKLWWNEAWMGWPVDDAYERSSNVAHAHRLEGKLLLIVGELDHNVDPASTMQVVDALVKADKDFELLVIPGTGHGAAETPYGSRRRLDFLTRHLLHQPPP